MIRQTKMITDGSKQTSLDKVSGRLQVHTVQGFVYSCFGRDNT